MLHTRLLLLATLCCCGSSWAVLNNQNNGDERGAAADTNNLAGYRYYSPTTTPPAHYLPPTITPTQQGYQYNTPAANHASFTLSGIPLYQHSRQTSPLAVSLEDDVAAQQSLDKEATYFVPSAVDNSKGAANNAGGYQVPSFFVPRASESNRNYNGYNYQRPVVNENVQQAESNLANAPTLPTPTGYNYEQPAQTQADLAAGNYRQNNQDIAEETQAYAPQSQPSEQSGFHPPQVIENFFTSNRDSKGSATRRPFFEVATPAPSIELTYMQQKQLNKQFTTKNQLGAENQKASDHSNFKAFQTPSLQSQQYFTQDARDLSVPISSISDYFSVPQQNPSPVYPPPNQRATPLSSLQTNNNFRQPAQTYGLSHSTAATSIPAQTGFLSAATNFPTNANNAHQYAKPLKRPVINNVEPQQTEPSFPQHFGASTQFSAPHFSVAPAQQSFNQQNYLHNFEPPAQLLAGEYYQQQQQQPQQQLQRPNYDAGVEYLQMQSDSFELPAYTQPAPVSPTPPAHLPSPVPFNRFAGFGIQNQQEPQNYASYDAAVQGQSFFNARQPHSFYGAPLEEDSTEAPIREYLPPSQQFQLPVLK